MEASWFVGGVVAGIALAFGIYQGYQNRKKKIKEVGSKARFVSNNPNAEVLAGVVGAGFELLDFFFKVVPILIVLLVVALISIGILLYKLFV